MKRWKLLKSRRVFESKWLSLYSNDYKLANGKIVKDYYHLTRPDYVLIVAVDKKDRIVVERRYRRGMDEIIYELPAGWIEKGKSPIDTAVRELKEETGFQARGDEVFELYPQPGFSSMKAYVVVLKIQSKGKTDLWIDEDIETKVVTIEEVKNMIKTGKIKDMGSVAAINHYLLKND